MVQKRVSKKVADDILNAMLILARTVEDVLETRVIESSDEPMSSSKLRILRLLSQDGPQAPSKIAKFLGTSKPAVTHMIDSLLEGGLVRRLPSTSDRRGFELKLTAKGERFFQRLRQEQHHLIRSAFREMGQADPGPWLDRLRETSASLARADRAFKVYCITCEAYTKGLCQLNGGAGACPYEEAAEKPARARKTTGAARRP